MTTAEEEAAYHAYQAIREKVLHAIAEVLDDDLPVAVQHFTIGMIGIDLFVKSQQILDFDLDNAVRCLREEWMRQASLG
jgi:hypothetical protein